MNTVVVYAHPYDGSFNHAVRNQVVEQLEKKGHTVDMMDLYEDGFNPVMMPADLKVFAKGEYADPLAESYVNRLQKADEVIFIFPVWWYDAPAILKGFFDKVLLKGHAYNEDENHNMVGNLNIPKAAIFTTANITKEIFGFLGDPIENTWINGILKTVGITNVSWIHCPQVHLEANRIQFMEAIQSYLQ